MPQSHLRTPVETRSGPVIVGERIATFSKHYFSPLAEISSGDLKPPRSRDEATAESRGIARMWVERFPRFRCSCIRDYLLNARIDPAAAVGCGVSRGRGRGGGSLRRVDAHFHGLGVDGSVRAESLCGAALAAEY